MKIKKLTFLVLASMAVGALAGCGKTEPAMPEEYDLLKYWAGNQAEEYYSVEEKENSTVITYTDVTGEDAGGWAYVARSFSYDSAKVEKFSEYKKVVFNGNLTKTSGTDIVMVKVEGSDGNQWEKRFTFAAEVKTYEFSLSFVADWTKVSQILFFANRSTKESGSGVITLNKMALSKEAVNPDYDIAPGTPEVPQGYAIFNGLASDQSRFDVNYHWGYSSAGGIKTEELPSGKFRFTWGGDVQKESEWDYVSSRVKNGSAKIQESGLKRIVFEVIGTPGQSAVLKIEAEQSHQQKETRVEFTGEKQTVEVDITGAIANADDTSWMALIFPAPGVKGAVSAGEITLEACYMDKTEVYVPVNVLSQFPQAWMDIVYTKNDEYTVTPANTPHTNKIAYNIASFGWQNVQFAVKMGADDWFGASNYTRVVGKFTADKDVHILIKAYDNNANEKHVDLKAGVPTIVDYDVDAATVDFSKNLVLFVGKDGDTNISGEILVEGLRLARTNACIEDLNGVVRFDRISNADAAYTAKVTDGDIEVAWNMTAPDYKVLELFASANGAAGLTHLKGTLVADANVHVLFKPADNGANEQKVELTANEAKDFDITIAQALDEGWGSKLVVFICTDAGDALTGKVVFESLRYTDGTHDSKYLPIPACRLFSTQALKSAAGGGQVEIILDIIAADDVKLRLGKDVYQAEIKNYNRLTGKIVFESATLGLFAGTWNPETKALDNCGMAGDMGNALEYNGYFSLKSHYMFWDCEGTTEQLQAQFTRRYNDPWTKDTGNADRFTSAEAGIAGKGMKVRAWSGGRYAFNPNEFEEAFECQNLSFWVYNSGSEDVSLRVWGYKAKSYGTNFEVSSGHWVAKAGQWTYLSNGFTKASIYTFQIADFTNKGIALVFDDICIF